MADREWLWADPIVLNFNSEPAYKKVNVSQWREARLTVQMKWMRVWLNQASRMVYSIWNIPHIFVFVPQIKYAIIYSYKGLWNNISEIKALDKLIWLKKKRQKDLILWIGDATWFCLAPNTWSRKEELLPHSVSNSIAFKLKSTNHIIETRWLLLHGLLWTLLLYNGISRHSSPVICVPSVTLMRSLVDLHYIKKSLCGAVYCYKQSGPNQIKAGERNEDKT